MTVRLPTLMARSAPFDIRYSNERRLRLVAVSASDRLYESRFGGVFGFGVRSRFGGVSSSNALTGAGAFIGSDTALVAPVTVGDGAIIAAGSVITHDVPPDALTIARAEQVDKPGWATRFRAKQKPKKKD